MSAVSMEQLEDVVMAIDVDIFIPIQHQNLRENLKINANETRNEIMQILN